MLTIDDVSVSYGSHLVLDRVSATLGPDPVAITGPSGSGKSTLLRVLAGHQVPDAGHVELDAARVQRASWRRSSDQRISVVHQDARLVPFLTAMENLMLACEVRGVPASEQRAVEVLESVGLTQAQASQLPTTLSGGEQQRVAFARAVLCGARALLADEPTGALDASMTAQLANLLATMATESGLMIVVATHDPIIADALPTRLHLCDGHLSAVS